MRSARTRRSPASSYRTPPKQGSRFDAGAGVRVRLPIDPYVKGSYIYETGDSMAGLFSFRQTVFWQNSQRSGTTSRFDLEKAVRRGSVAPALDHLRLDLRDARKASTATPPSRRCADFPDRRALAFEVGMDGESDAEVPLHEFGFKAAYRQSIARDWLIMEVRTSLTWPREEIEQPRKPSWGLGIGFEMFFGTDEFLARPVTF